MAEIYPKFPGIPNSGTHGAYDDPLHYVFAHRAEVLGAIEAEGRARAMVAQRQLSMHRAEGNARINVEAGAVDWTIWLEDRSAKPVAHIIERGGEDGRGGARPLTAAFPEVML